MTVYIASEDHEPWCHLCSEVVPATIEVAEKTDACAACLDSLAKELSSATGRPEWTSDWPTEPGYYWAWVNWRRSEILERVVVQVRRIADGPLYLMGSVIVSKGTDFAPPTFRDAMFCRIPEPPAAPLPPDARTQP